MRQLTINYDKLTEVSLITQKWDKEKQRVKNNCTNKLNESASEINTDLLQYFIAIQDVFKLFEVESYMPTPKQLRDAFIFLTPEETMKLTDIHEQVLELARKFKETYLWLIIRDVIKLLRL